MASMIRRGQRFLDYAEAVDAGARQEFETRPEPKPDSKLQPDGYSFSEAGRLRRDPYAIYARRILKLDPLDPFNEDPGAADRGNIYHAIVERFIRAGHDPLAPEAERAIAEITEQVFHETRLPLHIEAIWKPRFLDTARAFLAFERERRPLIKESLVELTARVVLPTRCLGDPRWVSLSFRTWSRDRLYVWLLAQADRWQHWLTIAREQRPGALTEHLLTLFVAQSAEEDEP